MGNTQLGQRAESSTTFSKTVQFGDLFYADTDCLTYSVCMGALQLGRITTITEDIVRAVRADIATDGPRGRAYTMARSQFPLRRFGILAVRMTGTCRNLSYLQRQSDGLFLAKVTSDAKIIARHAILVDCGSRNVFDIDPTASDIDSLTDVVFDVWQLRLGGKKRPLPY